MSASVPFEVAVLEGKARRLRIISVSCSAAGACLFAVGAALPVDPCEGGGFCVVPWWLLPWSTGVALLLGGVIFAGWAWAVRRAPP